MTEDIHERLFKKYSVYNGIKSQWKLFSLEEQHGEKLKDPRWQKLRLEVFERDLWKCVNCHCKTRTLHVHHKRYDGAKEPWEYALSELETLCEDCHKKEHKLKEAKKGSDKND